MKLKDLIEDLKKCNPGAEVSVIAHCRKHAFTLAFGGSDGGTKETAESVSFYVEELCGNDSENVKRRHGE